MKINAVHSAKSSRAVAYGAGLVAAAVLGFGVFYTIMMGMSAIAGMAFSPGLTFMS